MFSLFKSRGAEQAPPDPRVRLLAQIEYQESEIRKIDLKVRAGFDNQATLDRERAELTRLKAELTRLDKAAAASDALVAQREAIAPAVLAEYEAASADIDAALSQLEAAIARGEAVARKIERDFSSDAGRIVAPFTSVMVERLFFWNKGTLVVIPGYPQREYGALVDRLAEFRQIGQPPRPIVVHQPPVLTEAERAKREQEHAKRRRLAMQNSKISSRLVEGVGVTVETRQ